MKPLPSKLIYALLAIISIIALCLPAIINGYPIVNPDTSTYIESGFVLEVPIDRPIIYGILTRLFSLNGISLWFAIIIQAILVHYIIRKSYETINIDYTNIISSVTTIILAIFSSVSWITSELIADVYTPVMILAMACIATTDENKKPSWWLYVIFLVSVATHASHLMISLCILLFLWLFRKQFYSPAILQKHKQRILLMATLSISTYAINSSVFSKSSAAFMTAAIVNKGVLRAYLDAECDNTKYALCSYKNEITDNSDFFLWNKQSPLEKMGGWVEARDECNRINKAILFTYPYNWHFLQSSLKHTLIQAMTFNVGDGNEPQTDTNSIYKHIRDFVSKDEASHYLHSKQNTNRLLPFIQIINKTINYVIICTLAIILLCVILVYRQVSRKQFSFIIILLIGACINIAQCATFSSYNGRYGCKVMWLLPFSAIILILSILQSKRTRLNNV